MTLPTYLDTAIDRVCLMQLAVEMSVAARKAYPYSLAEAPLPYWTNVITGLRTEYVGEPQQLFVFTLAMTYRTDQATAGYDGEVEQRPLADIPAVLEYFAARPYLQRTAAEAPLDLAVFQGKAAAITNVQGPRVLPASQGQVWAVTYNLQLPFLRTVETIE